ncbi:MAG: putative zinc-binding metallopeptidase, partial [Dysgonamonadaceae bacterium]|nr:putative zinc-binding metallopeptidase [Dysgonamonadaceae bacterium]
MKKITTALCLTLFVFFSSCEKDNEFTKSIFEDEPEEAAAFDRWLKANYLESYNLAFRYRMQDVGSDLEYNLVPASYEKSKQIAILIKYLWFDAYGEVVNPDFLKEYGPRVIHLIGSGAYNPRNGTVKLGTAEGGVKVTLFSCNDMDPNNMKQLNEYCFKTMHHEFAHILHQQRTYPKVYETFSAGHYDPSYWQERSIEQAASLGFVSPYGSSQPREDFVEVIANYIVKTQEDWDSILDMAAHEWTKKLDKDGNPELKPN